MLEYAFQVIMVIVKLVLISAGGQFPKHTGVHVDFPHWVSPPPWSPFFFFFWLVLFLEIGLGRIPVSHFEEMYES